MSKRQIIIEEWESYTSFKGKLWEIDLQKIAEEHDEPELLEMDEEELREWWWDNKDYCDEYKELSVINESDGDCETNIYPRDGSALSHISWKGFWRGETDDMPSDWQAKQDRIDALKKELEELEDND